MRRDALRTLLFRTAFASEVLVLLASGVGFAQGFSGYEAFAGVPNSAGTGKNDNLFAGWTDTAAIANGWQRPALSSNGGGIAAGSVNYIGKPGSAGAWQSVPQPQEQTAMNGRGCRPLTLPVAISGPSRAALWCGPRAQRRRFPAADALRALRR